MNERIKYLELKVRHKFKKLPSEFVGQPCLQNAVLVQYNTNYEYTKYTIFIFSVKKKFRLHCKGFLNIFLVNAPILLYR